MQSLLIVGLSILACLIYGIIHDQVTVRLCLEYFTVFHAPIFETLNPTLLGIGWGILATWWVGLFLGIPLAVFARAGGMPKRTASELIRAVAILMLSSACLAIMAGAFGYIAALNVWIWMVEPWASRVPSEHHIPFLVCFWAHNASYLAGFVGGIIVMAIVWRGRLLDFHRERQDLADGPPVRISQN